MDQLTVEEMDQPLGIGGYKYAIFHRVDTNYWCLAPLRTLKFEEPNYRFNRFCRSTGADKDTTLVYCDQHNTLKAMCKHLGCAVRHPPPGQPRDNPVVERAVGLALQGISCCLLTAGLPNVFWPMVGHAFVVHYNLTHQNKDGVVVYFLMHGDVDCEAFIPGELVSFKPAPTITIISTRVAKVESNLIAGIFLDSYVGPDGKFTGQYICVCLEHFVGESLHRRVEGQHFKLRLHRTEVLRRPASAPHPVFPRRRKYIASNFTLKGLESRGLELPPAIVDKESLVDDALSLRRQTPSP